MSNASVRRIDLHQRIWTKLDAANVEVKDVKNVLSFPNVLRMFYLITPHALCVLDKDPALLMKLDDNFASTRVLSKELAMAIASKSLDIHTFGDDENPVFYSLSGTNKPELALLNEMGMDFTQNPTLEDISLCTEVLCGIKVASSEPLSPYQLKRLNQIFNPQYNILPLLTKRGISKIIITHEKLSGIEGREVKTEKNETGATTMYMSAKILSNDINNVILFLHGILD
ncbi:hypothetical protein A2230_03320 [candidate division WOR-1 bacterium RIFOXYA2_FULL_36_21]|uniref:Uncharacterized protein n=1 Tax=candidate division WOR-1 bacterium RIFOXYB2_FULL_36_35 TaxID=1802578 RepID=A0A1F4RXR4_UNCSA|nr:MAG: hypothetical protein A2230_03320 [candidate division WOR-1 bacterium RIFOXYA2_FULL_36_21]OGC12976.1 MAG: hypothetical protein A2290_04920 [candidate division WOR-1 bacterium RIFOXYB2_FULL_36_35]OGC19976.1 MAG: hypothetical protein A2282_08300 [candidate division WOR-1 bacterium RIFOXYA12_FULL_36_13]